MALSNIAIAELSPALQQSLKAMQPVVVVIVETILRCERKRWAIYLAAALMATGTVFVSVADQPPECPSSNETTIAICVNEDGSLFEPYPLTWPVVAQCIAITSSALKYVLLRETSRNVRTRLYPVATLFWVDVIIFITLMPIAIADGQFEALITSLQSASNTSLMSFYLFLASAAGGVYFFTELLALRRVDAIDVSATSYLVSLIYVVLQLAIYPDYNQGQPSVLGGSNVTTPNLPPTRDDGGTTAVFNETIYNATDVAVVTHPGWNVGYLVAGLVTSFVAIAGYITAVRYYSRTEEGVVVERSPCADKYALDVDNLCGIKDVCCLGAEEEPECCTPRRKTGKEEDPKATEPAYIEKNL